MKVSFKTSPATRVAVRAVVVAVLGYFVASLAQGGGKLDDWQSVAWGAAAAGAYALIGILTPAEPLVGVKTPVEVPVPPAEPKPKAK